ncbi:MAG: autoinducer synthase [Rhodobacteraceae bacterium]|nr:autoinducer synthase [Paracoccaceae bacterium]
MLKYLFASELSEFPKLRDTMFRDRADQFHTRLGWEVTITADGEERDEYDAFNPLYVIWEEPDGSHGGSMRFLPTSGPNMLEDHFRHLLDGGRISNPKIWECTRFCLARNATPQVSAALMLGGAEVGLGFGLTHSVGVFDARMVRIYRRLGWSPMVIGSTGEGRDTISVGTWSFSEARADALCEKAGIPRAQSRMWFHLSRQGVRRPELAHTA